MSNKLLIVDDDRTILDLASVALQQEGLEIYKAHDGGEALDIASKIKPDIILTDLIMPVLGGWELFEQSKEFSPNTTFIFMTGFGSIPDAANSIKKGVFDYLEKPFSQNKLKMSIQSALEYHNIKRENSYLKNKLAGMDKQSMDIGNALSNSSKMRELVNFENQLKPYDSEDDLLKKLLKSAIEITSSQKGSIYIYNLKNKELILEPKELIEINSKNKNKKSNQNMDNPKKNRENDISNQNSRWIKHLDLSQNDSTSRFRDYLSLPIEDANTLYGIIYLRDKNSGDMYDIEDLMNLTIIVRKVVDKLNIIRFNKQIDVFDKESVKIKKEYQRLKKHEAFLDRSSEILAVIVDDKLKIQNASDNYQNTFQAGRTDDARFFTNEPFFKSLSSQIKSRIQRAIDEGTIYSSDELIPIESKPDPKYFKIKILPLPHFEKPLDSRSFMIILENMTDQEKIKKRLLTLENLSVMGRLFASIAHDLNNPLDGLNRLVKVLENKVGDSVESEYFEMMYSTIKRMSNTIGSCLESTKNTMAQTSSLPLLQLLNEAILIVTPILNEKGIQVHKIFTSRNLNMSVCTDLCNVFINILKNSYDAMDNGGTINVSILDNEDTKYVDVILKDSGCGFPEDMINQLTQPFFTTKDEGTGLGLVLCEKIVKYHGGRLSFRNHPVEGAEVTVSLPIKPGENPRHAGR